MAVWGDRLLHHLKNVGMIESKGDVAISVASLDVRLGDTFVKMKKRDVVTLGEKVENEMTVAHDGIIIEPGEFMLATTMEYIRIPDNCAAFVHGRSSIGRLGLTVQNAGYIDPGFHGEITLELKNEAPYPIKLVPGYRVAQIVYMDCAGVVDAYKGKYNGQRGATATRMEQDHEASTDRG